MTAPQTLHFQAEVSRLLDIVTHALYSQREVFLRELIGNAADACDKLRYLAQTDAALMAGTGELALQILLRPDAEAGTLAVEDSGIGMSRDELVEYLGTIAHSGAARFMEALKHKNETEGAPRDVDLIGQFGVGFYSAFMVADSVTVDTRRAGTDEAWRWISDGRSEFTVEPLSLDEAPRRGTRIVLKLKPDALEFLETARLRHVVKTWSDHIALPIRLVSADVEDQLNSASALWTRPKSEISEEQYTEFYRQTGLPFDKPWTVLHWKAEGAVEFTAMLFVPSTRPLDLFMPERAHKLRLYSKRVFINTGTEGLLPPYLRFLTGVVDCEDLPLNVSREMLQNNPVLARIRQALTRRVLTELTRRAEDTEAKDSFAGFWRDFGPVLKEGLYEDRDNRSQLLKLLRVRSTAGTDLISLADYVARMKDGQQTIWYVTGDSIEAAERSPQLEGFKARGVEVLLLTDAVDDFWVNAVGAFEDKPFRSVTRAGGELDALPLVDDAKSESDRQAETPAPQVAELLAALRQALGDSVKDVRESQRLTSSAVCLVADEDDVDIHLERLLQAHHGNERETPRVLEVNTRHPLLQDMAQLAGHGSDPRLAEAAWLLYDQARIAEGRAPSDPVAFGRRLASALQGWVKAA